MQLSLAQQQRGARLSSAAAAGRRAVVLAPLRATVKEVS
jgi:hypothetical protein